MKRRSRSLDCQRARPLCDATVVCPFPKHQGKPWEDVIDEDRNYVEWLVGYEGPELRPELYNRLMELLEETGGLTP